MFFLLYYHVSVYIKALSWYLGCGFTESKLHFKTLYLAGRYTYLEKIAYSYIHRNEYN